MQPVVKTLFQVSYQTIGKPPAMETINVAAASMEDALQLVRWAYNYPNITSITAEGRHGTPVLVDVRKETV